MDWLDLLAFQGTLKGLLQHHISKASILWHSAFFIAQLSHPYLTTGKTIALTKQTVDPIKRTHHFPPHLLHEGHHQLTTPAPSQIRGLTAISYHTHVDVLTYVQKKPTASSPIAYSHPLYYSQRLTSSTTQTSTVCHMLHHHWLPSTTTSPPSGPLLSILSALLAVRPPCPDPPLPWKHSSFARFSLEDLRLPLGFGPGLAPAQLPL